VAPLADSAALLSINIARYFASAAPAREAMGDKTATDGRCTDELH
jgi:hypothetical protein